MNLQNTLALFLEENCDLSRPILVGYSGGPDSKALLYALREIPISLHVAHVDHGWREESSIEAKEIKQEIENLGFPYYVKKLSLPKSENLCREARQKFFSEICKKHSLQGVLLAHHKDDQAETVLKRMLEGAHLSSFSGIESVKKMGELTLFRPFLSISKKEILSYLEKNKVRYFNDKSNKDPKYLRARMREEIVPSLAFSFGKEIHNNLILTSQRSKEYACYLDEKTEERFNKVLVGPFGWALPVDGLHRVEVRHLLMRVAKISGCSFSRDALEALLDWTYQKLSGKRLILEKEVLLYRGWVFFLKSGQVDVQVSQTCELKCKTSWQDLFQGEVSISVPGGQYQVNYPTDSAYLKKLSKRGIPPFLRKSIPVLTSDKGMVFDFFQNPKHFSDKGICFVCRIN